MDLKTYNKKCIWYSRPRQIINIEDKNNWLEFLQEDQEHYNVLVVNAHYDGITEREIDPFKEELDFPFTVIHHFDGIQGTTTVEILTNLYLENFFNLGTQK